jgi:predicted GIY-YIG superfamily endonuclease
MGNATRTALYRIWGDAGLLLYIGITYDFGTRWKSHAKEQPWWGEMRRLTADAWYDTRRQAEDAEAAAIKAERPKYNKMHAAPAVRQDWLGPLTRRPSTAHAPVPFRDCHCRDPQTRKTLHGRCPRMSEPDHGAWYVRYAVPRGASDWDPARKRNQRTLGPFTSKEEAEDELAEVLHEYARTGFRVAHLPPQRRRRSVTS